MLQKIPQSTTERKRAKKKIDCTCTLVTLVYTTTMMQNDEYSQLERRVALSLTSLTHSPPTAYCILVFSEQNNKHRERQVRVIKWLLFCCCSLWVGLMCLCFYIFGVFFLLQFIYMYFCCTNLLGFFPVALYECVDFSLNPRCKYAVHTRFNVTLHIYNTRYGTINAIDDLKMHTQIAFNYDDDADDDDVDKISLGALVFCLIWITVFSFFKKLYIVSSIYV